jgi:hypothetical protein
MSNVLLKGIVTELCKCLKNTKFDSYIDDILKFNNTYNLLNKLGIIEMTSTNKLNLDDLEKCKVIITNHAYFFPHGHSNYYNKNCDKINDYLMKNNKKTICVFDEFDQYHKMGLDVINLNCFVANNLVDITRKQVYSADHAFRYCHKKSIEEQTKLLKSNYFDNDYYYKLPALNFNKKFEKDKDGIFHYVTDPNGSYDFRKIVLDNLSKVSKTEISYCSKYGKYVGKKYIFRRYDEITRYELNSDTFQDEDIVVKFLKINESIILIEQKIEICDKDLNIICNCKNREDVVNFAKENLSKTEWIKYYNTIAAEGTKLYIKQMVLRKKQFNFIDTDNYYLTATPGKLEKLGYKINRENEFKTPCKIKNIDIFVIDNCSNAKSDMELFFLLLKKEEFKSVAVANKQKVVEEFAIKNKNNKDYSNVNPVITDLIIDVGKEPSNIVQNEKNVTYIYQKGNQTQGTNYSDHVFLMQDCHIKIDIVERIIPISEENLFVNDYMAESKHSITQSCLRILRGELSYKAQAMFCDLSDESEEIELVNSVSNYLKKYGIDVNLIFVKQATKINDRNNVIESIIKHISDRHNKINIGEEVEELYTYDDNNLIKEEDKRKKYDENEIINAYCDYRQAYSKDKDIKPLLTKLFGISKQQFERIKKNNLEKIDNIINS